MFNEINSLHQLSYLGIFLWFVFLDQLTPIPEEVTLLSIGYIAQHHLLNPYLAGLLAFLGLTIIDNAFYWLTFSGNKLISRLTNAVSEKLRVKYSKKLEQNPIKTLLILSFIPKIRFFSPIFAGLYHVKWRLFFLVNGLGTIIFVMIYIAAGMFLHNSLEYLLKELEIIQHSIFIIFMVIITLVVFFRFKKKNKHKIEN